MRTRKHLKGWKKPRNSDSAALIIRIYAIIITRNPSTLLRALIVACIDPFKGTLIEPLAIPSKVPKKPKPEKSLHAGSRGRSNLNACGSGIFKSAKISGVEGSRVLGFRV